MFPGADPSRRVVMFLAGPPGREIAKELGHVTLGPDEAMLIGEELHLHCPDGIGSSKLPGLLSEKRLGVAATARNWRTDDPPRGDERRSGVRPSARPGRVGPAPMNHGWAFALPTPADS